MVVRAPAPLALMGLIFFLSAQSDPGADIGVVGSILAHAGEYLLLTVLWAWALAPVLGRRALMAAAAISLAYAVFDEIHQSFVAGRDSDPLDVVVDAAGIAVAIALVARYAWNRRPYGSCPDRAEAKPSSSSAMSRTPPRP